MNVSVFYKDTLSKKLCQINVADVANHGVALETVAAELKTAKEMFDKPMLALIQGGKA